MTRFWVVVLFVSACSDSTAPASPDAAPVIDAPPPPFLGTWREIPPSDVPPDLRTVLTITADHRFDTIGPMGKITGTWQLGAGNLITISTAQYPSPMTQTFVMTDDRLLLSAGFPQGSVDGIVGTWLTHWNDGGQDPTDLTEVFNADNTAELTYVHTNRTQHLVGTWDFDGTTAHIHGTIDGNPTSVYAQVIPGQAIGVPLYERLP